MTSLYAVTVPVFTQGLSNLAHILAKGEAFAAEQGIDPQSLLDGRLAPDMHPLVYQVQRASDTAKGTAIRIGGLDPLPMADDETTFADLAARCARTAEFLKTVPPQAIDGKEADSVVLKLPTGDIPFTGESYALAFALPNFFFHVTTTYAILRAAGVPLGKRDYLMPA